MKRKKFAKRWFEDLCSCFCDEWDTRDILITTEGIIEIDGKQVTDFLLFDGYFQYIYGMHHTGYEYGILLTSMHRKILLKAKNLSDYVSFLYSISESMKSSHLRNIQYGASSLVRSLNDVDFMVDAEDYFKGVSEEIERAEKQIFMCGWWISPELPLIRPYSEKYRLDRLLQAAAKRGVMIYIIAFLNPPVIPNDSLHTQEALARLHKNIKVLRHPCDIIPGVWSHH